MRLFYFLYCFIFSLPLLSGQIIYNSNRGEIGYLRIDAQNNITLQPFFAPPRNEFGNIGIAMGDIAISPQGEFYTIVKNRFIAKIELEENQIILIDSVQIPSILTALEFDKDGKLYIAGRKSYLYDFETGQLSTTPCSVDAAGGIAFYKDKYLISTIDTSIIEVDRNNACSSTITLKHPETRFNFFGLTITEGTIIGATTSDEIYEIDLEADTTYYINKVTSKDFRYGSSIYGLTTGEQFRTNFNIYLDLDADNSSGRFINHYEVDTFCVAQIPIADKDATLQTNIGIDSMVITFETANLYEGEQLIVDNLPSIFQVQNSGRKLVISKSNTNQPGGYLNALQQVRYDLSQAIPFKEERIISVTIYSGTEVSDVAKAFINVDQARLPYAGEDVTIQLCPDDALDPRVPLGALADQNGRWIPSLSSNKNSELSLSRDTAMVYQYIAQTGECQADTAVLTINAYEVDVFQNYFTPYPIFLCADSDTVLVDISIPNAVRYGWNTLENETGIFPVTAPGFYDFFIEDANGCQQFDFFIAIEDDSLGAIRTSEIITRCEGTSFQKDGISYTTDTLLCETFSRLTGCDSMHCIQLQFTQEVATTNIATTICEGQNYDLFGETLTQSGVYNATQTRPNQCDSLVALNLTVLPPKESVIDTLIPSGSTLEFNGFSFEEPGTYFITLNAQENGCDSLIRLNIDFLTTIRTVDLPTIDAVLFPNPTNTTTSQLRLQTIENKTIELRLLDYVGKQLWQQTSTIAAGENTLLIDLPSESGIYWLQLSADREPSQYFKVIKL